MLVTQPNSRAKENKDTEMTRINVIFWIQKILNIILAEY